MVENEVKKLLLAMTIKNIPINLGCFLKEKRIIN